MTARHLLLLAVLLGCGPGRREEGERLTVFAAASLTEAFRELGARFERARPDARVAFNFAGSQQLAAQVVQGARADVFASADPHWMRHLAERSLLAGEPRVFARNRVVVVVPRANTAGVGGLEDLARPGLRVVLGAEAVPAGRYARRLLEGLSRAPGFGAGFAGRVLRNVVSHEESVKAVLAKVQLGEADAGIVYGSDVTAAARQEVRVLEIPAGYEVAAEYPIAVLRGGAHADRAAAFVALVLSREGQSVLRSHGLIPAAWPEAAR